MDIVLGSSSPRRKMILEGILSYFTIVKPEVDESLVPGEEPEEYTRRISEMKSDYISGFLGYGNNDVCIITSDTTVACGERILGKPASLDSAVAVFRLLSGSTHRVITAVTLQVVREGSPLEKITDYEITGVSFKKLDIETIYRYLGLIEYRDKAGGYAFQEHGDMIIQGFSGSVTNIIGFPLRLFFSMTVSLDITSELFAI